MTFSLHRTIPFLAFAALLTVSPAGAQERDDSTSSVGGVVSLMGMGARFVVLSGASEDPSRPNAWSCAGGCRAFGARSLSVAPFGAARSAARAASRSAPVNSEQSRMSLANRADLSDYGWSRRVDADGSPLPPVNAEPTRATEEQKLPVSRPTRDGVGEAPAWVAPGNGPSERSNQGLESMTWTNEPGENTGEAERLANNAVVPTLTVSRVVAPVEAGSIGAASIQAAPLVTTVPEPSTVVLLAVGLASLVVMRRRSTRTR